MVTWLASNPTCSLRMRIRLRDNRPAEITSTTDSATWIGIKARPTIGLPPPSVVLDFNKIPGSDRPADQAGKVPKRIVVTTAQNEVTRKTVLSGVIEIPSWSIGSMKKARSNLLPYHAPAAPSSAPTAAITKLSVRYILIKRHLPAPIAIRTANSCRRI